MISSLVVIVADINKLPGGLGPLVDECGVWGSGLDGLYTGCLARAVLLGLNGGLEACGAARASAWSVER